MPLRMMEHHNVSPPKGQEQQPPHTWRPKRDDKAVALKTCGCIRVCGHGQLDSSSECGKCSTCTKKTRRKQALDSLTMVKRIVREHAAEWLLVTEWPLDGLYIDCMLVLHACASDKLHILAVELDGSTHNGNPYRKGHELWEAVEEQRVTDASKNDCLVRNKIAYVRLESTGGSWCTRLTTAMCKLTATAARHRSA